MVKFLNQQDSRAAFTKTMKIGRRTWLPIAWWRIRAGRKFENFVLSIRARTFLLGRNVDATVVFFSPADKRHACLQTSPKNPNVHAPNQHIRTGLFARGRKISWLPSRTGENGNFRPHRRSLRCSPNYALGLCVKGEVSNF